MMQGDDASTRFYSSAVIVLRMVWFAFSSLDDRRHLPLKSHSNPLVEGPRINHLFRV